MRHHLMAPLSTSDKFQVSDLYKRDTIRAAATFGRFENRAFSNPPGGPAFRALADGLFVAPTSRRDKGHAIRSAAANELQRLPNSNYVSPVGIAVREIAVKRRSIIPSSALDIAPKRMRARHDRPRLLDVGIKFYTQELCDPPLPDDELLQLSQNVESEQYGGVPAYQLNAFDLTGCSALLPLRVAQHTIDMLKRFLGKAERTIVLTAFFSVLRLVDNREVLPRVLLCLSSCHGLRARAERPAKSPAHTDRPTRRSPAYRGKPYHATQAADNRSSKEGIPCGYLARVAWDGRAGKHSELRFSKCRLHWTAGTIVTSVLLIAVRIASLGALNLFTNGGRR
ncbi:MAG: hypothetical protein ACT4QC_02720 [Planctomycetaceae bacterium]